MSKRKTPKHSTTDLGSLCRDLLTHVLTFCDVQQRGAIVRVSKSFRCAGADALAVSISAMPNDSSQVGYQLWVQFDRLQIPYNGMPYKGMQYKSMQRKGMQYKGMPPKSLSIGRPLYGMRNPGPLSMIMGAVNPSKKVIPRDVQLALQSIPVLRLNLGERWDFDVLGYPDCKRLELKGMRVEACANAAQSYMYEEMTFMYCTIADINVIFECCGSLRQITCVNSTISDWAPNPTLRVISDYQGHLAFIRG